MSDLLKISEAANLALHTMGYLASVNGQRTPTRKIAEIYRVSEAHLAKVMQRLVKAGLVSSTRGPGGGFVLARTPESISLLEVYEAIEGPLELSNCLFGEKVCRGERCILGDTISKVNELLRSRLANTRLSEFKEE